jgi:hypothetical protein
VAAGKLNKQVAADLGISEVMVKVHRAHGIQKMQVMSLAQLVRTIDHLVDNGIGSLAMFAAMGIPNQDIVEAARDAFDIF